MTHYQVVERLAGWEFRTELMTKHSAEACLIDIKLANPNSSARIEPVETVTVRSASQPIAV